MGKNKYPQTNLRLTDRDMQRIEHIKRLYEAEATIDAVRIAFYQISKSNSRPTPAMREMLLSACRASSHYTACLS